MEISLINIIMGMLVMASGLDTQEQDFKAYVQAYDGEGWRDPYGVCDSTVPDCSTCTNECFVAGETKCDSSSTLTTCVLDDNCFKLQTSTCSDAQECQNGKCVELPCASESCGNGVCGADCGETATSCPTDCSVEDTKILIINDIHAAEYPAYKTFLQAQTGIDFLEVNGDLSGLSCYSLDQCKSLFEGLPYPYYFTPGNHDLDNTCDGHIYDVKGNNVNSMPSKNLVFVRLDMCAIGSNGEGTFTAEDEAFLKSALDQYANQGKDFIVFTHCHTKLTWRRYHWPVVNAEKMNGMLESYVPKFKRVIVIAAHEHVTYNEVTNGVLYATVGSFGLCPNEYGTLTLTQDKATFQTNVWKADTSRCKYPLRHIDSSAYHTQTI